MTQNLCPEIHYIKTSSGLMITSCYGTDGCVSLPDTINGMLITAIAPYAFSEDRLANQEESIWLSEDAPFISNRHRLHSEEITEVHLPKGVREIGRYAFYRCRNLEKLVLGNRILDIGGGALNGCRIRDVEIHMQDGEMSALKSIVEEIRFAIRVSMYYDREDGSKVLAKVLFPEHYEEAVENTPARLLYTSHHGAGGYYRQCFYERKLDYKKYDELLSMAEAWEEVDVVIELGLKRLMYPYQLSEQAKERYEQYVSSHKKEAVAYGVMQEDMDIIHFLTEHQLCSEEALEQGIDLAGERNLTEMLGALMDEKRHFYPKKMKRFEL